MASSRWPSSSRARCCEPWAARIRMRDPRDVREPVQFVRKLRSGNDEAKLRGLACRLEQEPLQGGLPVAAVGPEIAKVKMRREPKRRVQRLVDGAIEDARRRCPVT